MRFGIGDRVVSAGPGDWAGAVHYEPRTPLEFFGTEGLSALHKFNVTCAESGVRWALVPSPAVARLLRICDPEGGLAAAPTVEAALAHVQGARRRLLELVRKS